MSAVPMLATSHDLTTPQGIFDYVGESLLAQGPAGGCVLRDTDGSKCAIGFLIPDERYHPSLEEGSAIYRGDAPHEKEVIAALDPRVPRTKEMIAFLCELQDTHDEALHFDDWYNDFAFSMRDLAARNAISAAIFDKEAA